MGTVAWLHLSDWHYREMTEERQKMRDRLIDDIENRTAISESLENIDFILFSGDLTFSGARTEFDGVKKELIDRIRSVIRSDLSVYSVPGNHDIDRARIPEISLELRKQIAGIGTAKSWQEFNNIAMRPDNASELNKPLTHFFDFIERLKCKCTRSKLYSVAKIKKGGITIGLICINTAWNSARFTVQHAHGDSASGIESWLWDYGLLRITEAQLQHAVRELGKVELCVLMMHHPLHWIDEFERTRLEQMLFKHCHIVIHGHEHRPNTSRISSAFGDLVFIPAGATYVGPAPEDPRYTNAYNFTVVDTNSFFGTVHHRIWMEEKEAWLPDDRFWLDGKSEFVLPKTKNYDIKLAHRLSVNANKQYVEFIGKRVALDHEITIRHEKDTVDGQEFIRHRVKIRIRLRAGSPEKFEWATHVDEMIVNHPNAAVRKQAYKLLRLSPNMRKLKVDKKIKNKFRWGSTVSSKEQWLEYEYAKLDLPNNAYYINIPRFTDRVKLSIKRAEGYNYDYLSLGGFPPLIPKPDLLLSVDTIETNEMILPSQGYIIQWRPEHKKTRNSGQHIAPALGLSARARHRR